MGGEAEALAAAEEACRVYVGNLVPKAKETHLQTEFARFGVIHNVWIARRPPGFAFVRFSTPEAAQRAVEACRVEGAMEILGKPVRVQMAGDKAKEKSKKSAAAAEEGETDKIAKKRYTRGDGATSARYMQRRSQDEAAVEVEEKSEHGGPNAWKAVGEPLDRRLLSFEMQIPVQIQIPIVGVSIETQRQEEATTEQQK
ncbi:hypothetical protein BBJ28_00002050 [Nothophytophthora sp. Chile5]|nr:hypothetical protein BBJ28_00002050 [Nothophytophthora sp. Chile5]